MKRLTVLIALYTLPILCHAQMNLKEIQQKSKAQAEARKSESDAFRTERLSKWKGFIDHRSEEWAKVISERDVEWSGFLSDSEWTLFDDFLVVHRPQKPKPELPPKAEPVKPTVKDKPVIITPVLDEPKQEEPKPEEPKLEEPKPEEPIIEEPLPEEPKSEDKPSQDKPKPVAPSIVIDIPQPVIPPVIKEPEFKNEPTNVEPKETIVEEVPEPDENTVVCKPALPEPSPFTASFGFYGSDMAIAYDNELASVKLKGNGQKDIAKFWKEASETNYTPVVERLLAARDEKHLSGYAYYMLVSDFAKTICTDTNHARVMTWFLLVRSGYGVKIGYSTQEIVLLLPSEEEVYEKNYLMIDGRRFYLMTDEANPRIYTYRGEYSPGHDISFSFARPMLLGGRSETRDLSFDFEGKTYSYSLDFDPDLIGFYKNYPMLSFEQYFNAAPSEQLRSSIAASLKPLIAGMNRLTALNFLLHAVQLSFDYKTDPQQFGYEKYFYADELIAYPYCDCEDRSVLFTYLAHELLGYDAVGTEFVGHMASAIALDSPIEGTNYNVRGRVFTIADPTYMNADVGQCMPDYRSASPKIHFIDFAH